MAQSEPPVIPPPLLPADLPPLPKPAGPAQKPVSLTPASCPFALAGKAELVLSDEETEAGVKLKNGKCIRMALSDAPWLEVKRLTETELRLAVQRNRGPERKAKVSLGGPSDRAELVVVQRQGEFVKLGEDE